MSSNALHTARAILAIVIGQDNTAGAEAGHCLSELGLDSLDRVLLAVLIEQETGRPVPDEVLAAVVTVGDIVAHLDGQDVRR